MARISLKNKPLIEAIFELRWKLEETTPMTGDPYYKIQIGRIYERVKEEYPFHEQLPTANVPDEIVAHIVQHRFRKSKEKWPLMQIGPGILTLNDTDGYDWEDFEKRISRLVEVFFETYPEPELLAIDGLLLRYINAVEFNYEKDNIFEFLRDKMKISVGVHQELFQETGVTQSPLGLDLRLSFPCAEPEGTIKIRFARGKKKEIDALVWETVVQSVGENAPQGKEGIAEWAEEAHNLTSGWFFKIIQGELLRRFE
jgi:uncharacterized protein (TIGR04255 family)